MEIHQYNFRLPREMMKTFKIACARIEKTQEEVISALVQTFLKDTGYDVEEREDGPTVAEPDSMTCFRTGYVLYFSLDRSVKDKEYAKEKMEEAQDNAGTVQNEVVDGKLLDDPLDGDYLFQRYQRMVYDEYVRRKHEKWAQIERKYKKYRPTFDEIEP